LAVPARSDPLRGCVVDDVLATGGTVRAVCDLLKKQQANIIGVAFLIELSFLKGKNKLKDVPIYSIVKY
jgi:adenine phosphoribosyltransferase